MPEYDEGILLNLIHQSLQNNDTDAGIYYVDELLKRYLVDQRIEQIKYVIQLLAEQYPIVRKRYSSVLAKLGHQVRFVEQMKLLATQMD